MSEDEHAEGNEQLSVKIVGTLVLIFACIPLLCYGCYKAFQDYLNSFPDDNITVDPKITMIETEIDTWT